MGVVPKKLIILRGGYIGIESSQLIRRLGSKVTVVTRSKQLLLRKDAEIADVVKSMYDEDETDVLLKGHAINVKATGYDEILLVLSCTFGPECEMVHVEGLHILFVIGWRPNTDRCIWTRPA